MVTQHDFLLELWLEYGLGSLVYALRFVARWRVVGFSGWSWDDLFAAISWLLYTIDGVLLTIVSNYGSNVGLNEQSAKQLSQAQIETLTVGSKVLFAAWFSYISMIWTLKGSVIGFYYRLTYDLWTHQKFVRAMAAICGLCWAGMMLLIFCRCTPIQRNWQIVPYAGDQCTLARSTYITLMVLNVSTDLALIFIPAHLLYIAKMPLRQKMVVGLLLSSSFFIIACAIVRGVVILEDVSKLQISFLWGTRETFITIVVTSLPLIKPLFSKKSPHGSSYPLGSSDQNTSHKRTLSKPKTALEDVLEEDEFAYNMNKLPPSGRTSEYDGRSLGGSSKDLVRRGNSADYASAEAESGSPPNGGKLSPFEVNVTTELVQVTTVEERAHTPVTPHTGAARQGWGRQRNHVTTEVHGGSM